MTTQPLTHAAARKAKNSTAPLRPPEIFWWSADGEPASLNAEERDLVRALRAGAATLRRRWSAAILPQLECLRDLERKNGRRLDGVEELSLQALSDCHDETLQVAFDMAAVMADSNELLTAMGHVQANVTVRIARLEKRVTLTSFWKRRSLSQELNRLRAAKSTVVDADLGVIQRQRQLLKEQVEQLYGQAHAFRDALLLRCGGTLLKWERQRETWIQTGMENWERAQNGLRLLPLPPLKVGDVNVRVKGIVQQYNALRRQGIIRPEDGGPDVLVTRSSLQNANVLHPGQRVGFVIRQTDVGPWAQDVIVMRTT